MHLCKKEIIYTIQYLHVLYINVSPTSNWLRYITGGCAKSIFPSHITCEIWRKLSKTAYLWRSRISLYGKHILYKTYQKRRKDSEGIQQCLKWLHLQQDSVFSIPNIIFVQPLFALICVRIVYSISKVHVYTIIEGLHIQHPDPIYHYMYFHFKL